jgi:ABC-2 type transport system permease protein
MIAAFGLLVFQVPFRGSALLFALAALLFVIGNLGMGLWISSWAPTIQTATMFSSLMSILPGMMLSGFMFPIKNMPLVVQAASYIFPARYFMTISRTIFLKGGGLDVLGVQFVYLAGYAVVMLVLAAVTFRKRV